MSLVSVGQCRALVDTPLDDGRLQDIIEREEQYITDKIGAPFDDDSPTLITEVLNGNSLSVFTSRRITSVTSVTEYATLATASGTPLVSGSSFHIWPNQGRIQRLGATKFGERVDVVYTPKDERARRRQCIIDLVRLTIARPALASEDVAGEYQYEGLEHYEGERQNIVGRLTLNRF